jgi:hypothetical protein
MAIGLTDQASLSGTASGVTGMAQFGIGTVDPAARLHRERDCSDHVATDSVGVARDRSWVRVVLGGQSTRVGQGRRDDQPDSA